MDGRGGQVEKEGELRTIHLKHHDAAAQRQPAIMNRDSIQQHAVLLTFYCDSLGRGIVRRGSLSLVECLAVSPTETGVLYIPLIGEPPTCPGGVPLGMISQREACPWVLS